MPFHLLNQVKGLLQPPSYRYSQRVQIEMPFPASLAQHRLLPALRRCYAPMAVTIACVATGLIIEPAQALPFPFELSNLNGTNGFALDGRGRDRAGRSVSAAGDVNGDGVGDFIIGGVAHRSSLVFGRSDGHFPLELALSELDGRNGFVLPSAVRDQAGWVVSDAGDVNADGFDDLIVGAPFNHVNGLDSGRSYVIYGHSGVFPAEFALASLDGANGFIVNGVDAADRAGSAVSGAGDINGDGVDDVLIGATYADPVDDIRTGQAYIVFGRTGSRAALLELAELDGANGFALNGIAAEDRAGSALSGAGDVNGDGVDDLIIGAHHADPNDVSSGQSYVIYGRSGGFPAALELSSLDGADGFAVNGINRGDDAGISVSAAGDVNNDGLDDLLIGAFFADVNDFAGQVYLIYGRSQGFAHPLELSALANSDGFMLNGINRNDSAGRSVSAAGDVNGDGFDDIIIGASDANQSYLVFGSDQGFPASMDLSRLDGSTGFILNGAVVGDTVGYAVSGTGDINDDGFADIILGTYRSNHSYVVFGHNQEFPAQLELSTLDGANGFIVNGSAAQDRAGFALSAAGDVNDDGLADVIVGVPGAPPNGVFSGQSYLIYGRRQNFPAALQLSELDASYGFALNGINPDDFAGSAVSGAGDFNGDGVGDLIIGAHFADPNFSSSGQAYLVYGRSEGFSTALELSELNGANGFVLNGITGGDHAGYALSGAGDVNGDGFDDIVIGAPFVDFNESFSYGQCYLIYGRAQGLSSPLELSALSGTDGFAINGIGAGNETGGAVSGAGDFNGDGVDDIVIGAQLASPNGIYSGRSYLIYGRSQGFTHPLQLSALSPDDGFIMNGAQRDDLSGSAISAAGDINGDGFDDIIIGARGYEPNDERFGRSYLVFGRNQNFATALELSALDGANGFVIKPANVGDGVGRAVSAGGDINGDGVDDLLVGAYVANPNGFLSGQSYVIFGRTTDFPAILELSSLDTNTGWIINGIDAGDLMGSALSAAGDLNGDGVDDLILGAYRANPTGEYAGQSYIIFGTRADLSLAITATPDPVRVNTLVDYTMTVNNQGPSYTSGVQIEFPVAAALSFVNFAPSNLWSCNALTTKITCTLNGELLPDNSALVTLTLRANPVEQTTQITHYVSVGSTDFDPNPVDNNVITVTTVCDFCPGDIFRDQFE